MLTTSSDLVHLEVALRECEMALQGYIPEVTGPPVRQSLPCDGGYFIEISAQEVHIEFLYGDNNPESDVCRVPLALYQSLLLDYYYHLKGPVTYPNGQIKMTGVSDNYLRYGMWIEYYENGRKKSEGEYFNSQKVGTWRYYYENGLQSGVEHYNNHGLNNGKWEYWYENGNIKAQHNFKDGTYSGDHKYWYPSGTLQRHHRYGENNYYAEGEQVEWHENGKRKSVFVVKDKKTVEYRNYDMQGNLINRTPG